MALPAAVLDFLNTNATRARVGQPGPADDLFSLGVLDSFEIVNLISILEEECGIRIPDADVNNADNFRSINAIDQYVESRKD